MLQPKLDISNVDISDFGVMNNQVTVPAESTIK